MPESHRHLTKRIKIQVFHTVEDFIPAGDIWTAFAKVFWTCPLCGATLDPVKRCSTPGCWNHLVQDSDPEPIEAGSVDGDYPILGIECPRCEFEASTAPLCHKCQKEVAHHG